LNTLEYLNAVKAKLGIESDYALAQHLGITRSAVSVFTRGKGIFGDDVALAVAEILGVHPFTVIAQANAERAKTPEQRARWSGVMEKFSVSFLNHLLGSGPRQRYV
jgi:plasmid maintenance system antidote protein VapI